MFYKKFYDLVRRCSFVMARLFNQIGITANQITIGSFVVFSPIIFYCFSRGIYVYNLLGLFFLIIRCYFDYVDGQVARLSNKSSVLGGWLDDSFDHFTIYGLILSVGWGMYKSSLNLNIVWLIIIMFVGYLLLEMVSFKYTQRFGFKGVVASEELRNGFNKLENKNFIDIFIGNLIGFWSDVTYFIFGFSYFFLLSVIFNQIFIFFIFFTFTLYLRFFTMYFVYIFLLSKRRPKSILLKFLREINES